MGILKYFMLIAVMFVGSQNLMAKKNNKAKTEKAEKRAEKKLAKKLDKQTKKKLKSYLKKPSSFRTAEKNNIEKVDNAIFEKNALEDKNNDLKATNLVYVDSINALILKINEQKVAVKNTNEVLPMEYKVQIGVYAKNNFNGIASMDNSIKTVIVNGVTSYYIGSFDNPFDAESFGEALREMGIFDAFVSKFVNGERVAFDIRDLQ